MKIYQLEKKLKQSGYQQIRNGKGSHRIYRHLQSCHTISLSGSKGKEVKPYQRKFIR